MKLLRTLGIAIGLMIPTYALASVTGQAPSCCPGSCCPSCPDCPFSK
jgi:hypothetical protein